MQILYIIVALGIGFGLGRASKKTIAPSTPEELAERQESSREALHERTEERKEEIIRMMENAEERHEALKACNLEVERKGVNRRDVEELLGVSEKTALRYLDKLEAEGKIRQIGVGRGVYYTLYLPQTQEDLG